MIAKEKIQHNLDSLKASSNASNEEQRARIGQLEEQLENEQKKNQQLVKQSTEQNGNLSIKEFMVKQMEDKITLLEGTVADLKKENEDKRAAFLEAAKATEDTKRALLGVEKDRNEFSQ